MYLFIRSEKMSVAKQLVARSYAELKELSMLRMRDISARISIMKQHATVKVQEVSFAAKVSSTVYFNNFLL